MRYLWKMNFIINDLVGPTYRMNDYKDIKHNDLLQLMDKKNTENIFAIGSIQDMARMNCIANNGAMAWLNVMYNFEHTRILNNQQTFIALSLVSGLPIFSDREKICEKCKQQMDKYGHHALSCSNGGHVIKRHDGICNVLKDYLIKAEFIESKSYPSTI